MKVKAADAGKGPPEEDTSSLGIPLFPLVFVATGGGADEEEGPGLARKGLGFTAPREISPHAEDWERARGHNSKPKIRGQGLRMSWILS